MKYIFLYAWYILALIITAILVLIYGIINSCLLIWHLEQEKTITWSRFMRRRFMGKKYLTDIDMISTYKRFAFFDDEGEILCNKHCEPYF